MNRRYPVLLAALLLLLHCHVGRADDPFDDLQLPDSLRPALIGRIGDNRLRGARGGPTFSPDGKLIAAAGTRILVWDAATGRLLRRVELRRTIGLFNLRFVGSELVCWDSRAIQRWRLPDFKPLDEIPLLNGEQRARQTAKVLGEPVCAFRAATGELYVQETESQRELLRIAKGEFTGEIAIAGEARLLVCSSANLKPGERSGQYAVRVWDLREGKLRHEFGASRDQFRGAISPDGVLLVQNNRTACEQWDARTGRLVRSYPQLAELIVKDLTLSPDNRSFVACTEQGVFVYDLKTGEKRWEHVEIAGAQAAEFSPDSSRLAVSHGATIRLFDAVDGKELFPHSGRLDAATSIHFSPGGRQAVAYSASGELSVFDSDSLEMLHSAWLPPGRGGEVEFLADGKRLIEPRQMQAFEFRDGRPYYLPFPPASSNRRAVASRDGSLFAQFIQTDHLYVTTNKPARLAKPYGDVAGLAISDDKRIVATVGNDRTVRAWERETGKRLQEWVFDQPCAAPLAVAPHGTSLAVARGKDVLIGNIESGATTTIGQLGDDRAASLAYSPAGARLALGDARGKLRLFDLAEQSLRQRSFKQGAITRLLFSADSGRLYCGCESGRIVVCEAPSLESAATLRQSDAEITALALSDDGRLLAAGDARGAIAVWDVDQRRLVQRMPPCQGRVEAIGFSLDHAWLGVVTSAARTFRFSVATGQPNWNSSGYSMRGFAQSPDGRYFAALTFDAVQLWDAKSGFRLRQLTGPKRDPAGLRFSPDSRRIAVAGGGRVIIQSLDGNGKVTLTGLQHISGMTFSPDGRLLAVYHDSKIVLHNAATGIMQHALKWERADGFIRPEGMQFTPDGRLLIAQAFRSGDAAFPRIVGVWETATGGLLYSLGAPSFTAPLAIALSPDGNRLLTGLGDGTILAWDFPELTRRQIGAAEAPKLALDEAWAALAGDDPAAARRAILALSDQADAALQRIAEMLSEIEAQPTPQELIARLGSRDPAARREASTELRALGASAHEAMQSALKASPPPSPAVRARLELLLAAAAPAARDDELRVLRCVEVLERIGGEQAVAALKKIAVGAPPSSAVSEAQAALRRLKRTE